MAKQIKQLIQPTFDRILIRRKEAAKVTDGGMIVPDQSQQAPTEGTIVAIGPHVTNRATVEKEFETHLSDGNAKMSFEEFVVCRFGTPQMFNVGDEVAFGAYAGKAIEVNGELFTLVKEDEIEYIVRNVEVEVEGE